MKHNLCVRWDEICTRYALWWEMKSKASTSKIFGDFYDRRSIIIAKRNIAHEKWRRVCGYGTSYESSKSAQEEVCHTWGTAMIQRKHDHTENQQSRYPEKTELRQDTGIALLSQLSTSTTQPPKAKLKPQVTAQTSPCSGPQHGCMPTKREIAPDKF